MITITKGVSVEPNKNNEYVLDLSYPLFFLVNLKNARIKLNSDPQFINYIIYLEVENYVTITWPVEFILDTGFYLEPNTTSVLSFKLRTDGKYKLDLIHYLLKN